MNCSKCGKQINESDKFCGNCGFRVMSSGKNKEFINDKLAQNSQRNVVAPFSPNFRRNILLAVFGLASVVVFLAISMQIQCSGRPANSSCVLGFEKNWKCDPGYSAGVRDYITGIPTCVLSVPSSTLTPTSAPVPTRVRLVSTPVPTSIQGSTLKIEQCRAQAPLFAKDQNKNCVLDIVTSSAVSDNCGGAVADAPDNAEKIRRQECYKWWMDTAIKTCQTKETKLADQYYADCLTW